MATLLDATLLQGFAGVFSFLIVFIMIYAALMMNGKLKLGNGPSALLAFAVGILTLFSPKAVAIIRLVTPWYVTFFFLILIIFMGAAFFGSVPSDPAAVKGLIAVIGIVCVLIFIFGWSTISKSNIADNTVLTENQKEASYTINEDGERVLVAQEPSLADTIFTPALLGVLAFLIIGAVAIVAVTH